MNFADVEKSIKRIPRSTVQRYSDYWAGIKPVSLVEHKRRWWFAFLSIRSQWKANKNTYALLARNRWESKDALEGLLHQGRIGLVDRRSRAIWEFTQAFDACPGDFMHTSGEDWSAFRKRLVKRLYGVGIAKVSFSFEMCWPMESRTVCIDTHIMQMYGVCPKKGINQSEYHAAEGHWLDTCESKGYAPAIARHILWDKRQNKRNTRYWSHVLEN